VRITVCELPDDVSALEPAWDRLARALDAAPTNLLVLPELAGAGSFWTRPEFDQAIWREAVARHAQLPARLKSLAASRVLGTRAVETDGRRLNESFLWTAAHGLQPGRAKAWLPEQEEGWEATWFDRGPPTVEPVEDDGLRFATP